MYFLFQWSFDFNGCFIVYLVKLVIKLFSFCIFQLDYEPISLRNYKRRSQFFEQGNPCKEIIDAVLLLTVQRHPFVLTMVLGSEPLLPSAERNVINLFSLQDRLVFHTTHWSTYVVKGFCILVFPLWFDSSPSPLP